MKTLILCYILTFISSSLYAQGNNLREECRKKIAGLQLELRDKVELSKKRLRRLTHQNQRLKEKLKEVNSKIAVNLKKQEKEPLNFDLKDEEETLRKRVELYSSYIENNLHEVDQFRVSINQDEEDFLFWLSKFSPALRVKHYKGESPLGYPYEVVYTRKCPDYMTSCPLNEKEKAAIKEVYSDHKMPTECERYIMQN